VATPRSLKELAALTGAELRGPENVMVEGVASLASAGPHHLSFVADPKHAGGLQTTRAGAVIVPPNVAADLPVGRPCLVHANPYLAFIRVTNLFVAAARPAPGVHSLAFVHPEAVLEADVAVGPFCVVAAGARIGAGTVLVAQVYVGEQSVLGEACYVHPQVVIREQVQIGSRVILQPGAVIGGDGFGFLPAEGGRYVKIPQVGTVVLEDDVEIGANTTVDRAALDQTRVGRGCKLDNLVMIAHNVVVDEDTVLAAQAGIAGSTRVGKHVTIAGQVGTVGHITIGDNAVVGAQAGVIGDVVAGEFVSGYPARPHKVAMRQLAELGRLPDLKKKIADLEQRLRRLEGKA